MTWLSNHVVHHLRAVATWPQLPADRYVIERPIGRGGMGTVYAALDERLGREVAVKVSNAAAAGTGLDERLRREAEVLASLEHPGIVPVHDAGTLDDGRLFYVMKLVRGETLVAHVQRLRGEAALLGVFERIVETVAFAHTRGVVHRDLKPSNVMVGRFGEVLVLDWGVAHVMAGPPQGVAPTPTRSGGPTCPSDLRVGTPGFMAPEHERAEGAGGPTSDVFSLGALLAWMLKESSVTAPRRLRAIVQKCLAPEPAARYANAGELASDFALYRAGLPVTAHRDTAAERFGRWFLKYQTFIVLVLAYLLMRVALVFL